MIAGIGLIIGRIMLKTPYNTFSQHINELEMNIFEQTFGKSIQKGVKIDNLEPILNKELNLKQYHNQQKKNLWFNPKIDMFGNVLFDKQTINYS